MNNLNLRENYVKKNSNFPGYNNKAHAFTDCANIHPNQNISNSYGINISSNI